MPKILLVEDDNNLREIYEARLQAEGYDIVSAMDGEEALVVAKKEKPDLVISDVMMPRISGFEMLDILRNTDGLKDVKVIMLTALGQAEDKTRADSLGADRYLVKSQVTLEDIVKAAQELLGPADAAAVAPAAETTPAAAPAVVAPVAVATPPAPTAVAPSPAPIPEPAAPVVTPVAQAPAPEPVVPVAPAPEPTPTPVAPPVEPTIPSTPAPAPEPAMPTPMPEPPVPALTPAPEPTVAPVTPPAPVVPEPAMPVAGPVAPTPEPTVPAPAPEVATPSPAEPAVAPEPAPSLPTPPTEAPTPPAPTPAPAPVEVPAPAEPQPELASTEVPAAVTEQADQAQSASAEQDAIKAQIESFVNQNNQTAPGATDPGMVASAGTTPAATPPAPAPVASSSNPDDTMMANAIKGLVSDDADDSVKLNIPAGEKVVTPPSEANVVTPTPGATNTAAPAPAAPTVSDEDNSGVTHKKIISPITESHDNPQPDINELLAKEGLGLDDDSHVQGPPTAQNPTGLPTPPHPPGHVISPNGNGGVDPNSIAL